MKLCLLLMVIGTIVSATSGYEWYLRTVSDSCQNNDGTFRTGYCKDCLMQTLCSADGSTETDNNCIDGNVCYQDSEFSACANNSLTPACECDPSASFTTMADPYDNQKFLVCVDGEASAVESCTGDAMYNPDAQGCKDVTTIPPTTVVTTEAPDLPTCDANTFNLKFVSCQKYVICFSNGKQSDVITCNPGEVFIETAQQCEFYTPFSCADHPVSGVYADTTNCSASQLCINGTPVGEENVCSAGEVYDQVAKVCTTDDTKCVAVTDCGICPDQETRIKIDCTRYYQCTMPDPAATEEEPFFTPVLKECPPTFAFNEDSGFCELESEVPGCPEFERIIRNSINYN